MAKKRKPAQISLDGSFVTAGSSLISGTPMRVELNPFVPRPEVQPRLFTGDLLPAVEIPKPKGKKAKPPPNEQMSLFED